MLRKALNIVTCFAVLTTAGCIDEQYETLPSYANAAWKRSVTIDASRCQLKDGTFKACAATDPVEMLRVRHMSGVIGAPLVAVENDPDTKLQQTYRALTALWARVPVGYGCEAAMQGVFPDASKDVADIKNYQLSRLSEIIGAARSARAVPIWTAAYGLGKGDGACNYGEFGLLDGNGKPVAELAGTAIGNTDAEIANWAKAVRKIIEYYDLELPKEKAGDSACNPPAGTEKPWFCSASLFNIEFGRDPNGAGGYSDATKVNWLKAYKAFATEIRARFPWPANTINLLGPSVVIRGKADIATTTGSNRNWIYDFIDYVVAEKLPLSFLTFELVAATPVEAADIAKSVKKYADEKGLKDEDGNPIRLFVMDLRVNDDKLPKPLKEDVARRSAYLGAFYAATKALWQGTVFGATIGRSMRSLSTDPTAASAAEVATKALDSELMWYNNDAVDKGSLKPAAWHSFWFYDGFLGGGGGSLDTCGAGPACSADADCADNSSCTTDTCDSGVCKNTPAASCAEKEGCKGAENCNDGNGCTIDACDSGTCTHTFVQEVAGNARRKSLILVGQGPDAIGVSGTQSSEPVDGLITIATRERCVSSDAETLGQPVDCVTGPDAERFPAVAKGRPNVVRVFVADLNWDFSERETLRHDLRVQIDGLPADTKTVGYRWATIDGDDVTWSSHNFPDQGVLDVEDGTFYVHRTIAVPSMHYFEFLF